MIRFIIGLIGISALAQQPPIMPLRPVQLHPSFTLRTNVTPTKTIVVATWEIPTETKAHYYAIRGEETTYLGEMTKSDYERWAFTGSHTLGVGGGPQVQYWTLVFSTTNRIEPTIVHSRHCP